jgi:hypothetical protein
VAVHGNLLEKEKKESMDVGVLAVEELRKREEKFRPLELAEDRVLSESLKYQNHRNLDLWTIEEVLTSFFPTLTAGEASVLVIGWSINRSVMY